MIGALVAVLALGCVAETTEPTAPKTSGAKAKKTTATPLPGSIGTATPAPGPGTATPTPGPGTATPTPTPGAGSASPSPFPGSDAFADLVVQAVKNLAPMGAANPVHFSVSSTAQNLRQDAVDKVAITLSTGRGEPDGETFFLTETGADTGIFEIDLVLTRLYDDAGQLRRLPSDGKLSVDAEGSAQSDEITITIGTRQIKIPYTEPPSTVTGVMRVGGSAVGGALITLIAGNGTRQETASRADGSYAFHDVSSGAYTVVAAARGAVQQTFKVTVP